MTSGDIFQGIGAVSQLGMAIAVSIGVFVAYVQSRAWRVEWSTKKRADIAERLLSLAYEARHRIAITRAAFESVPADAEDTNKAVLDAKWARLKEGDETFEGLRKAQVMVNALIPEVKEDADASVGALFGARQEIFAALSTSYFASKADRPNAELEDKMRRIIYAFGSDDEFAKGVSQAIERLENALFPKIRAEYEK